MQDTWPIGKPIYMRVTLFFCYLMTRGLGSSLTLFATDAMLHSKAVSAEGRRNTDGPLAVPAHVTKFADGEGMLELEADVPQLEESTLAFKKSHVWHWALSSNQQPRRVVGDAVSVGAGIRCVVEIKSATGALQSVQTLPRLTGRVASRASPQVGQIEPDEAHKAVAAAKVFLRLSEMSDALQLPAVGERVDFHLAPNPDRSDRLLAADVMPLEDNTLARQPISRTAAVTDTGAGSAAEATSPSGGGGGFGNGAGGAPTAAAKRSYQPGCRVYVGRLPAEVGWRELSELFAGFGELLHVQLPLDDAGRRRGFGLVELEKPEAAAAAIDKLQLTEIKGQQLVVRDDEVVVNERANTVVYVGNLAPLVTWQVLKDHLRAVDPSGNAQVRVPTDTSGAPMGFGLVEFRTQAAADAAVWTLHNTELKGRVVFLRQECDMNDQDGAEAAVRREVQAKNVGLLGQVGAWVDAASPLVEWGWSEKVPSCWMPQGDGAPPVAVRGARGSSLEWAQLNARLRKLVTTRMDASQLQSLYERQYGERIDVQALGGSGLRDVLESVPCVAVEMEGSRAYVEPVGGDKRGRGGDRRERDRDRDDRGRRERPRERDDHRRDDRGRDGRGRDDRGRERSRDDRR